MANIYVGNTDNDWFDFLASLSGIDEVNFWKPSAGNFKAISEGERFAFRLKTLHCPRLWLQGVEGSNPFAPTIINELHTSVSVGGKKKRIR